MTELAEPEAVDRLVKRAKLYAALSGVFDAKQALPSIDETDVDTIVAVTSALAAASDTNPDQSEGWVLRSSERHYLLQNLREKGELQKAIDDRRRRECDEETQDLLLTLEGKGEFAPDAIRADLQGSPSLERLQRIVVALDRAGNNDEDLLLAARSVLAAAGRAERRKEIEKRGFFGRTFEKQELENWLRHPEAQAPVRAAFLTGLPGIGKSALLEEMVRLVADAHGAITVRLDFDRAGLDVQDILGLTMEVARQLGERLGDAGDRLLKARLQAASQQVGEDGLSLARRSGFPHELAAEIGLAVGATGQPVTLVLDTLEVLRARGFQHPSILFSWIDDLVNSGMRPVRIIAAGRGDALDGCRDRVGLQIDLKGLDDEAAIKLTERLGVASRDREAVLEAAGGNPLVLRLAADVVREAGSKALKGGKLEKDLAAGYLYRILLSRIDDPLLRKLAHPGLVTRRISAALLREVLAPVLELPPLSETQALAVFDMLASQHWLVVRDPADPEFVIHRGDLRAELLPLLYQEEPELCARIDRAAVTWFGRRSDASSQLDAAYHRLQLLRQQKARPPISSALAIRFDDEMLSELPQQAQDIVLRARGGRTSLFQGVTSARQGVDEAALASEVLNLLDRQDWAEGQYVVDQAVEAGGFDPRSQAADAVRAFYWRAGKWLDARRLLAERDRLGADDSDLMTLPWPLALARLEMRSEFTPARLPRILGGAIQEQLMKDLNRSIASPSRHGSLAFRLAPDYPFFLAEAAYAKDADPVAAACAFWGKRNDGPALRAIDVARDRLASRGASIMQSDDPSHVGQLLASHSPYVIFAANLATQSDYGWLMQAAVTAAKALADAGALFVPPLGGSFQPASSSPFADISHLGLFAEWADSVGFMERDPNLRMIGRASERWRRTVGGAWQYGKLPPGWQQRSLDAVVGARTTAAADAGEERLRRLDLWTGREVRALTLVELRARLARSISNAGLEKSDVEKARRLLRWNVPSAFVPALVEAMPRSPADIGTKV